MLISAALTGQALALGCDQKSPVPGHVKGSLGFTQDVPTSPCPIGHYELLQKKRNSSPLFAQPTGTIPVQTQIQQ